MPVALRSIMNACCSLSKALALSRQSIMPPSSAAWREFSLICLLALVVVVLVLLYYYLPTRTSADVSVPRFAGFSLIT